MQYQQSDPAKMHSRLLANTMKQLKSVDEEVSKMCNIVEEYVAERLAEKKAATAKANSNLTCIKNLMKSMQLSAEDAMAFAFPYFLASSYAFFAHWPVII